MSEYGDERELLRPGNDRELLRPNEPEQLQPSKGPQPQRRTLAFDPSVVITPANASPSPTARRGTVNLDALRRVSALPNDRRQRKKQAARAALSDGEITSGESSGADSDTEHASSEQAGFFTQSLSDDEARSPGIRGRRPSRKRRMVTRTPVNEGRKLISHLLARLKRRTKPAGILDLHTISDKAKSSIVKGKINIAPSGISIGDLLGKDSDEEDEQTLRNAYSTEETYELMFQLRDVYMLSVREGWNLHLDSRLQASSPNNSSREPSPSPSLSPYGSSRDPSPTRISPALPRESAVHSPSPLLMPNAQSQYPLPSPNSQKSPNFPTTPSRNVSGGPREGSRLLFRTLNLIADVVLHDCRHKITYPRPSRPPFALQSVVLDLATLLGQHCASTPRIQYELGMAMLPAFSTFDRKLWPRIMRFFEVIIVPQMVLNRQKWLSGQAQFANPSTLARTLSKKSPRGPGITVQTIDITSAPRPAISHFSYHQSEVFYSMNGLYVPLLAALLENIDPTSMTNEDLQATHELLETLVHSTPDLYLDVLKVIAHGSTTAAGPHRRKRGLSALNATLTPSKIIGSTLRRRGCTFLFSYWPRSCGHVTIGKPLPRWGLRDDMQRRRQVQEREAEKRQSNLPLKTALEHEHQYMPFRFTTRKEISIRDQQAAKSMMQSPTSPLTSPAGAGNLLSPKMQQPHSPRTLPGFTGLLSPKTPGMSPMSPNITFHHTSTSTNKHHPSLTTCSACQKLVEGFGIRCSGCPSSLHLDCYSAREGSFFAEYYLPSTGVHRVFAPRFSIVQPSRRSHLDSNRILQATKTPLQSNSAKGRILYDNGLALPLGLGVNGHAFRLVNIFTLVLCTACHLPLWGCLMQGYYCTKCSSFAHAGCLVATLASDTSRRQPDPFPCQTQKLREQDVEVDWDDLREDFLRFYDRAVLLNEEDIKKKVGEGLYRRPSLDSNSSSSLRNDFSPSGISYEELSILYSVLWAQAEILANGSASGCILIKQADIKKRQRERALQVDEDSDDSDYDQRKSVIDPRTEHFEGFELQKAVKLYQQVLEDSAQATAVADEETEELSTFDAPRHSRLVTKLRDYTGRLVVPMSGVTFDFFEGNEAAIGLLFEDDYLAHITSQMKIYTPEAPSTPIRNQFLQPNGARTPSYSESSIRSEPMMTDEADIPLEIADLSHCINWLKKTMSFSSSAVLKMSLEHLHYKGFLDRTDGQVSLFGPRSALGQTNGLITDFTPFDSEFTQVHFPVPFGMDDSPNVDILIMAIETCLEDIDITMNECGLLLLTRRCWPDGSSSLEVLARLVRCVLAWVFNEDDKLLVIARDYTAAQVELPGVREGLDRKRMILEQQKEMGNLAQQQQQGSGGGAYVLSRNLLKDRYVIPWMWAVLNINAEVFKEVVYEQAQDIVLEKAMTDGHEESFTAAKGYKFDDEINAKIARELRLKERLLRYIIKLWTSGLAFSTMDALLSRWLQEVDVLLCSNPNISKTLVYIHLRALHRLYSARAGNRFSVVDAPVVTAGVDESALDPLAAVVKQYREGGDDGLRRALRAFTLMVQTDIGLPRSVLSDLGSLLVRDDARMQDCVTFLEIIWQQILNGQGHLLNRGQLANLLGDLNNLKAPYMEADNLDTVEVGFSQKFVKLSLALLLYTLNCDLDAVRRMEIVDMYPTNPAMATPTRSSIIPAPQQGVALNPEIPIIRHTLKYARLQHLNVQYDVVKTYWGIFFAGNLVSNRDEFLRLLVPDLIPSVWEMIGPTFEDASQYTIQLFMTLLNAGAAHFHASLRKTFDSADWMVRSEAIDCIFGIVTKFNEAFAAEWRGSLKHVAPLFSYLVSSYWDTDERIRTKCKVYLSLLSKNDLHIAFRCWELYFREASVRQKMILCKLMVQANAKFSDWNVLSWPAVIHGLEGGRRHDQMVDEEGAALPYGHTRDSIQIHEEPVAADTAKAAHVDNLRQLLLTLALQMLGNGIPVTQPQILTIKYHVVKSMGFDNCKMRVPDISFVVDVTFGQYVADPLNFSTRMMLYTCLAGIKKAVDGPHKIQEETLRGSMLMDDLESKPKEVSKQLVGAPFIDVIIRLFEANINWETLGHFLLRVILDALLIIVYKHEINDETDLYIKDGIIESIKKITDLLLLQITEENKRYIVIIALTLLKRHPMNMVNILGKQIITVSKLMTQLKHEPHETLFLQCRDFLQAAYVSFATNGLFVLIFKNPIVASDDSSDLDMFFVLRHVMNADDVRIQLPNSKEEVLLREQPINDVMNQLFKFTSRPSVSIIILNLGKYVERVYHTPWREKLITDMCHFLSKFGKHISEWKTTDINLNPIVRMSSFIIQGNAAYAKVFIPSLHNFMRQTMDKFPVDKASLDAVAASVTEMPNSQRGESLLFAQYLDDLRQQRQSDNNLSN